MSWNSSTLSHVGNVRKLNEDSCLDRAEIGLWVVADGMGGHAAGDLASQLIVNTLAKLPAPDSLTGFVNSVEDGLLAANRRLVTMAGETKQTIGSTVVVLLVHGAHGVYMWAGDSRLYRLRNGKLTQLTTDHSQVESMIQQGIISRAEAGGHPAGNMVTRAVGASENLFVDVDMTRLEAGDRYLLCSDGLDKHVADREIEKILGQGSPEDVAQKLIDVTLSRGAVDNVTVSVIEILPPGAASKRPPYAAEAGTDAEFADEDPDTTLPGANTAPPRHQSD